MNALEIQAANLTPSQQPEVEYKATTKSKSKEQKATVHLTFQDAHVMLKECEQETEVGRLTTNLGKRATLGRGGGRTRGRDRKGPQPDQQPCLSFLFLGINKEV